MWFRKERAVKEAPEQPKDYRTAWESADYAAQAAASKLVRGNVYYLPKLGEALEYHSTNSIRPDARLYYRDNPYERPPMPHHTRCHWFVELGYLSTEDLAGIELLFPAKPTPNTWTPDPVAIDPR